MLALCLWKQPERHPRRRDRCVRSFCAFAPAAAIKCSRRDRTQTGRAVLASADQGSRLSWAGALVATKLRAMELQAGQAARKGNKPGAAHAYNVKELRNREIAIARHAEQAYETFVRNWQPRGPAKRRTGAANEERR